MLLPCKLADAALLMSNIVFVLAGDGFEKVVPVHRVFVDMLARPFCLSFAVCDLLFGEGALALLRLSHKRTVGEGADESFQLFFVQLSFRRLVERDGERAAVHCHNEHVVFHTADAGRARDDRLVFRKNALFIQRKINFGDFLFDIPERRLCKREFDKGSDHPVSHSFSPVKQFVFS